MGFVINDLVCLAVVERAGELFDIERPVAPFAGRLDQPSHAAGRVGIADELMVKLGKPGRVEPEPTGVGRSVTAAQPV